MKFLVGNREFNTQEEALAFLTQRRAETYGPWFGMPKAPANNEIPTEPTQNRRMV